MWRLRLVLLKVDDVIIGLTVIRVFFFCFDVVNCFQERSNRGRYLAATTTRRVGGVKCTHARH